MSVVAAVDAESVPDVRDAAEKLEAVVDAVERLQVLELRDVTAATAHVLELAGAAAR